MRFVMSLLCLQSGDRKQYSIFNSRGALWSVQTTYCALDAVLTATGKHYYPHTTDGKD